MPPTTRSTGPSISAHAAIRMQQRRISVEDIELAIHYGTGYHARNARIFVIGRREIRKNSSVPRITDALNGLHVVCTRAGSVVTCYRNRHFKRSAFRRPRARRRPRRRLRR